MMTHSDDVVQWSDGAGRAPRVAAAAAAATTGKAVARRGGAG